MDIDNIDIFSKLSTGTFALISGLAIIGIITYLIYVIIPIEESTVLFFSILTFALGILIPVFFFMEDLAGISDIVGKFMAGVVVAVIVWISYHSSTALDMSGTELSLYIILPAVFTFLTSLVLVKGVVISLMEGEGIGGGGWDSESYDDDETWDDESDEDEFEYGSDSDEDIHKDHELFPEEKHKW